jgi:hypothetical protein
VEPNGWLGRHGRGVERTVSWLLSFRRLAIRYDRSATTITAVATQATTVTWVYRLSLDDYGDHLQVRMSAETMPMGGIETVNIVLLPSGWAQ